MKRIFIFLTIIFSGCSPKYLLMPREIKESFTQCYNGKIINTADKIKFNGYYVGKASDNNDEVFSMLFYKDGSVAFNVHGSSFYYKERLKKWGSWGTYLIKDDYIITQMIIHNAFSSGCLEAKYLIINDTTLEELYTKDLVNKTIIANDKSEKSFYILPLKFIKIENKPDSTCWLKEKKWFWCDKQKYKEYKKWLKEQKKKK